MNFLNFKYLVAGHTYVSCNYIWKFILFILSCFYAWWNLSDGQLLVGPI